MEELWLGDGGSEVERIDIEFRPLRISIFQEFTSFTMTRRCLWTWLSSTILPHHKGTNHHLVDQKITLFSRYEPGKVFPSYIPNFRHQHLSFSCSRQTSETLKQCSKCIADQSPELPELLKCYLWFRSSTVTGDCHF